MKAATALAGFVLIASSAHAQATAEQLARCAAMRTSTSRLQCYDALAKSKPAAPRSGRVGNWTVSRETDPISDQKGVTFLLEAEGGGLFDTRNLIIRCKRGELDLYVSPHEYLGEGNDQITIRLGTDAPVEERWSGSSDHTALFHPGDRAAIEAFVRSLARYDRAAFQVNPYDKAPLSMVFRLAGIAQVTQELWATCPPPADSLLEPGVMFGPAVTSDQVFMEAVVDERPQVLSAPQVGYPPLLRQAMWPTNSTPPSWATALSWSSRLGLRLRGRCISSSSTAPSAPRRYFRVPSSSSGRARASPCSKAMKARTASTTRSTPLSILWSAIARASTASKSTRRAMPPCILRP